MSRSDRVFFGAVVFVALSLAVFVGVQESIPHPNPGRPLAQDQHCQLAECYCDQRSEPKSNIALGDKAVTSPPYCCSCCCDSNQKPKQPDRWSWAWWLDSPITVFTGLLVVAGMIQTFFLWKSFETSASAARSAESTSSAVKKTFQIVERSSLSVDNWGLFDFAVGQKPNAMFQIWNSGRVPAIISECKMEYYIGVLVPPIPNYENPLRSMAGFVRPFSFITQPLRFNEEITEEQFEMVTNRAWCVFMWGRIAYTDGFKEPHETGFGVKAVYQRVDTKTDLMVWTFEFIPWPDYHFAT